MLSARAARLAAQRASSRSSSGLRCFHQAAVLCNSPPPPSVRPTQSIISPMRRTTTWLEALRAREKQREEWVANHKKEIESGQITPQSMPLESYSYTKVGTTEVQNRSPTDSFSYVILPFKSDHWSLDPYINAYGRLRIGQIFQDLDSLAGVIAYKHCSPAQPVIVTASVDRIYMRKRLDSISECNVSLSGHITWTGRSSMEITIKAATHQEDLSVDSILQPDDVKEENVFLTANFTFVARDPVTKKSFAINKLVPETEAEKADFERAEKYNLRKRLEATKTSLINRTPTDEESDLIHNMWVRQRQDPNKASQFSDIRSAKELMPGTSSDHQVSVSLMQETHIASTGMMQPQYRNRHSYMIFGGYLLRQTFELAYTCAAAFSHSIPRFVSLDSTTFRNPVPVGSVLYLNAVVVYTSFINRKLNPEAGEPSSTSSSNSDISVPGTLVQVRVDSTVRDLVHGTTTNTGHFTYSYFVAAVNPDATGQPKKPMFFSVLPQTYSEMMEYLEGRRSARETANFTQHVGLNQTHEHIVSE